MLVTSPGLSRSLRYWSGCLFSAHSAARHRVARGVVAADDQQQEIAHELVRPRRQIARRLAMRQHRDQVRPRRLLRALVPELGEVVQRLLQHRVALLVANRSRCRRACSPSRRSTSRSACAAPRTGSRTAWPASAWSARSRRDPPSRTSRRAAVRPARAAVRSRIVPDSRCRFIGATIGDTTLRCSSCFGGSIEMKLGRRKSIGDVAQHDAAHHGVGRDRSCWLVSTCMMSLVPGHRPVRAVHAVLAPMHRVLAAQALEIRLPDVVLVQPRLADVDLVERHRHRRLRADRH